MPIKKSAKKALRQAQKRTLRNKAIKENYKKLIKKSRKEMAAKKKQEVAKTLSEISSTLDKAAKRGVIHKNKAARIKSRLMKRLKKTFNEKIALVKRERIKPEPSKKSKKEEPKKQTKRTTNKLKLKKSKK